MIRISGSYSKKVPADQDYSSQQYHAGIEVELPDALAGDGEGLKKQLAGMFRTLKQAVDQELKVAGDGKAARAPQQGCQNNNTPGGNGNGPQRSATKAQVRAVHAIANRLGEDVASLVRQQFGVENPEQLTVSQASQLIEKLKEKADQ